MRTHKKSSNYSRLRHLSFLSLKMERSPFSFPNTSNSSSQTSHIPSFDPEIQEKEEEQPLFPSSNYNNYSSPPVPPSILQADSQHMVPFLPIYGSAPPAYSFAVHTQTPAHLLNSSYSWSIHDPSAAAVSFQTTNYQYSIQQKVAYDAWATKAARNRRKMARQKCIQSSRSSSSFVATLTPTSQNEKVIPVVGDDQEGFKDDSYVIFSNNKKLKLVFKKKLKNSDVSQLGRIVIPKKDAEENLPPLTEREGIKLVVTDLHSDRQWILKYKFWSNNKSRMYVLENTGDFLKKNGLKMGDTIILYVDEHYNYFFSAEREEEVIWELSGQEKHFSGVAFETQYPAEEEDDAALALLIENLRHSDGQEKEANNLLTMSMGIDGRSYTTHTSSYASHQDNQNTFPFLQTWMGYQYQGGAQTQGGQSRET